MLINATPDKEKIESVKRLIDDRISFVKSADCGKFPTIIAENYYEIIKELMASILLLDGLKTIGENAHKELIEAISRYKILEESEIRVVDDLRIKRNKSCYEGRKIEADYLENKAQILTKIIEKLKRSVETKTNK